MHRSHACPAVSSRRDFGTPISERAALATRTERDDATRARKSFYSHRRFFLSGTVRFAFAPSLPGTHATRRARRDAGARVRGVLRDARRGGGRGVGVPGGRGRAPRGAGLRRQRRRRRGGRGIFLGCGFLREWRVRLGGRRVRLRRVRARGPRVPPRRRGRGGACAAEREARAFRDRPGRHASRARAGREQSRPGVWRGTPTRRRRRGGLVFRGDQAQVRVRASRRPERHVSVRDAPGAARAPG